MAYAFDGINSLLKDGENQPSSADIFGQQAQGQPQGGDQAATSQGAAPKTDASADLGAAGSAGGAGTNYRYTPSDNNPSAYSSNIGKSATPKFFTDANQTIKKNQDDLQASADAFVKNTTTADQANWNVSSDDLNKAASGDEGATKKVRGVLSASPDALPAPAEFKPSDTYNELAAGLYDDGQGSSKAGVENALRTGYHDPNYTQSMAQFDAGMLQADPQFQKILREIQGNYQSSQDLAKALPGQVTDRISSSDKKYLSDAQAGIKSGLTGLQQGITDEEAAAAQKANDALRLAKSTQSAKIAGDQRSQALEAVKAALRQARPGADTDQIAEAINNTEDPLAYLTWRGDYKPEEMVTPEEAARFNQIGALLGQSQAQVAAGARGPEYNFDNSGLFNSLMSAGQSSLAARDKTDQERLNTILGRGDAAAKTENDLRHSMAADPAKFFNDVDRKSVV